jgi:large subunit ribosomal protein L9
MKVILLQDLRGLGKKNDIREVSEGYARNFLMPRSLVRIADAAAVAELKARAEDDKKHADATRTKLNDLIEATKKTPLIFKLRVGEKDEVFGSVTPKDIKEEIKSIYPSLDQKEFEIKNERPIKALGSHDIVIDLGGGVEGKIKVLIEKA